MLWNGPKNTAIFIPIRKLTPEYIYVQYVYANKKCTQAKKIV